MNVKGVFFHILGLLISVASPFVAVISFFPIWKERGASTVLSGFTLCLMLICAIPLLRVIKHALRSPSAPILWLVFFIIFLALSKIASEMSVICFIGFISNLIGAMLFKIGEKCEAKNDEKQN